jgi:Alr-MurF fusion protein
MAEHAYTLAELAQAAGGTLRPASAYGQVDQLVIDSRQPVSGAETLFVALEGTRHDGHRFLPEVVEQGVRVALVRKGHPLAGAVPCAIEVEDTLVGLRRIAAWHRQHFKVPVVGITGSNGKTIVKEWLHSALGREENVVRSPGSWNSQVGVPLSLWQMNGTHTLGIFEAGISAPGEMQSLEQMVRPTLGIFTNIGPAHGENFANERQKALEKALFFRRAQQVVYCADHAAVAQALAEQAPLAVHAAWSRHKAAYLRVAKEQAEGNAQRLTLIHAGHTFSVLVPFGEQANVENALHVITALLLLGRSPEHIATRIPHLAPIAMRLQEEEGILGSTLINDSYSNDIASLTLALEHLTRMRNGRRSIAVLSDIEQSGQPPRALYTQVADLLRRAKVDDVWCVGAQLQTQADLFANARHYRATEDLLRDLPLPGCENAVVLIKGARTFGFERVAQRLQRQAHGTVLEVDLAAVRHNLNHYRALRQPGVRLMAMVKAFGYGSGAAELARTLQHERVDYLGVAYADEGMDLRQNGVRLPIMVMNPEPVPHDLLERFDLETVVYGSASLAEVARCASPINVHVKLDTGMHRLGFQEDQLEGLLVGLAQAPHVRVRSVLSHLAGSEDPAHDDFTRQQLGLFQRMADRIEKALGYRPLRHIANSAAISRFPEAQLDMVRVGIGLHGIGANATETAQLLPVLTWRTVVAQVHRVRAGESVGYGRAFRAPKEMWIAVLPVGYADGLSRRLGNGHGRTIVRGGFAPFVGRICMDMCMADVSDLHAKEGDAAILCGGAYPLQQFAQDMGTIPYEVLTGISQRVKRIYLHG